MLFFTLVGVFRSQAETTKMYCKSQLHTYRTDEVHTHPADNQILEPMPPIKPLRELTIQPMKLVTISIIHVQVQFSNTSDRD